MALVHAGDEGHGAGRAPRALPGARQRRLVDKVDDLVAAEAARVVVVVVVVAVVVGAARRARQVLEGVRVLRAPPLAMEVPVVMMMVMVVVALLGVGDQAVPAPLAARQGGAVAATHYHVLAGAPPVKVGGGDLVDGPHVGFVVGVSSCRGHLEGKT